VHRFQHCGLPIVDLIHAGNMGLVEAARRFDASREPSFVGYASWWVRQAMIHAISDRQGAPMLSPSVVATPAVDPAALPLSSDIGEIVDELEYAAADDDVNLDETFDEIQLRASGTPRLVDRLRSQLN
jgi:RNA polymerase sigma factor (sigma-70 family)